MFYQYYNYITLLIMSVVCVAAVAISIKKPAVTNNGALEADMPQKIINKAGEILNRYYIVALGLIFVVFMVTRLYMLGFIPVGIMVDEVGVSYDAVCLLNYGVDRHFRAYPVYPTNFGDGNSAMYTYFVWFLLHFIPFSVRNIRLPAVICAIPCFFASYGIVNRMFKNRVFALLGPIFVTFNPYFFEGQRWGFDCNLMLSVVTVAIYFVILALEKEKPGYYALAGAFLGITLWTYILSYLMLPLFAILLFLYLAYLKKFRLVNLFALFVPMGIIGFPLLLEQLVNMEIIPEFTFMGSDFWKLNDYRSGQVSLKYIGSNFGNIIKYTFGGDRLTFDCFREFSPVYWCCVPLLVLGFYSSILAAIRSFKQRKLDMLVVVNIYGIAVYFVLLMVQFYDTHKANMIFIELVLVEIAGIWFIYENVNAGKIKQVMAFTIAIVLSVTYLLFSHFYFFRQTAVYGFHNTFLNTEPGDIMVYTENMYNPNRDKNIYINVLYEMEVFSDDVIALWTQMDPKYYQTRDDGYMDYIYLAFPENFDINEDAIYILGDEYWDHISSALIGMGFQADKTFPGYTICYR